MTQDPFHRSRDACPPPAFHTPRLPVFRPVRSDSSWWTPTKRSRCIRIATVHGAYRMELVVAAQIPVELKVVVLTDGTRVPYELLLGREPQ